MHPGQTAPAVGDPVAPQAARPTVTVTVPRACRQLSTFPAMDTICSVPIPSNPISNSPLRLRQRPRVHLS